LDWCQAISCNRKPCFMAQFVWLAALFLARFQRTDMYRWRLDHLSLSKPTVWYSVCGLLGCDTAQSYPLIPWFRRNMTVILKIEAKCATETSVSTDNYMTLQPRRPYLNTRFCVNLDFYTILNSSIIFPGKKVSFP
jgi:uncharacterized membrane protein